jgi:hypothetical protein
MPEPKAKSAEDTAAAQRPAVRGAADALAAKRDQERVNPGDHPNLFSALVAFQAEMPTVPKSNTARIPGRNGAQGYSYRYADLVDVTDAAMPLLTKHGLGFVSVPARTEAGAYELVGTLFHALGETLTGALPLTGRQAQEIGSSLTYGRRYLLGTMTGIVTDEDEDGNLAAQNAQRLQETVPPPTEPEHVAKVRENIATLSPENQAALRTWWPQTIPALARLNPDQAQVILGEVARLADPWNTPPGDHGPDDPWANQAGGGPDPT